MKYLLLIALVALTGCKTLNPYQAKEYKEMEYAGHVVYEDSPTTAAWLGILPGGGSFYTGQIASGILSLVLWPYSILWDPMVGHSGAKYNNYHATKWKLDHSK